MGHAKAIIGIDDPTLQLKVYNRIMKDDLSVRKVEELVKKMNEPPTETEDKKPQGDEIPAEYENLKDHLSGWFNLPIEFKRNNKGAGRIVIPFKTDQELEHIVEVLDKLK
jgi:ParB family chromosome partitioning protein